MEQIERIKESLRKENKTVSEVKLDAVANALFYYHEAKLNIQKHGTIVAHPKTGAPIENPYNKVLNDKMKVIRENGNIKSDITFNKMFDIINQNDR